MKTTLKCLFAITASLLMVGCQQSNKSNSIKNTFDIAIDTTANQTIKVGNSLFSLPSPYQLSILIKKSGVGFNEDYLNPASNYQRYTTIYSKAVNLGVYGCDMAYINIYDQVPLIASRFSIVKMIAEELELTSIFSKEMIDRIETNASNKDSLLIIMSGTYSDVDAFLKNNQRQREGSLVLAGGWVEAMYILSQMAYKTNNADLIDRLAESRQPLENLIKILSPYIHDEGCRPLENLVSDLVELANEFDMIDSEFEFVEPETKANEHLTIVRSRNKMVVQPEVLKSIVDKLSEIRAKLIE